MPAARYRHLVWDWNGTLLDDVALCLEVMNQLLDRHRLPALDQAGYRAIFDFPVRTFYERAGFDLHSSGSFERVGAEWMHAYEARRLECPLHAGARAILQAASTAGLTQSVLSAYPHASLEAVVRHHELAHHFVRLLGLGDIYANSKVELGRCWIEELALPPGEVVLIGDTLHDLEVAETIGIDCVLVAAGHQSAHRLRTRTPRVIADLASLGPLLGLDRGA